MIHHFLLYLLLIVSSTITKTDAFYLPGVAPTTYHEGDEIPLVVNHLKPTSFYSHKETHIYSYDYYNEKLHFCQPAKIEKQPESLGSVIFGDRLYNSPFILNMLENKTCETLCKTTIPGDDAKFINELIEDDFVQNWLIDGLPVARKAHDPRTNSDFYYAGFDLGYTEGISNDAGEEGKTFYFINHFDITIEYHDRGEGNYRIVGILINPASLERDDVDSCDLTGQAKSLSETEDNEVTFTYSVSFVPSDTLWATRWDKYFHTYDPKIQWFSLINFSIIVVLLSSVMIHSLFRALRNDIQKYNELNLDDEFEQDSGWKLLHADIFRSPIKLSLLSVFVGSGFQIFLMTGFVIFLAMFGLLSPSNRGSLPTVTLVIFALFGFIGSFTSMTIYKFFGGTMWKMNMVMTPILVPGVLFLCVVCLNVFLLFSGSSDVIPFGTLCAIVGIWILLSLPLSFAGSLIAWKKKFSETSLIFSYPPTKTNQIPRQIPVQPWYLRTIAASFVAGIFPFGSIAVQLYFIYNSLWYNKIFYMFGFLFVSFVLLTFTTALVTVLLTYYSLCLENWKWCWRSFIVGGLGVSTYVFIHSILFTKFNLGGFITIVLYCGYSAIISLLIGLCTGALGFLSSLLFVKKIYGAIRVD